MVSDWPGSYHLYRDPATCRVADRVGPGAAAGGTGGHPRRLCRLPLVCHPARRARPAKARRRWFSHLTSFDAQLGEARHGAIPCRASALAAVRVEAAGDPPAAERWRLLAETEKTMIVPPRFAAYPQCEDALWRSVQRAMIGELSPADAMRRAGGRDPGHRGHRSCRSRAREAGVTFDGKTVLVTGAAKGIGQAVALHMAPRGRARRDDRSRSCGARCRRGRSVDAGQSRTPRCR